MSPHDVPASDGSDVEAVVIPLTWRSYLRAVFFSGMLMSFGIPAAVFATNGFRLLGVALVAIAVVVVADFLVATRRWQALDSRLVVPRLWALDRSVEFVPRWAAGLDSVVRRDSLFLVDTPDGSRVVSPNLLTARTDVMQWLYLIGERRSGRA